MGILMKKARNGSEYYYELCMVLILILMCLVVASRADEEEEEKLRKKCSAEFEKVTACLPFVTGKAATATKECCNAVTDIKKSDPACLCFIIQQIHNGSNDAVKSMGVQEGRLLQLPSACKLANASVTQCPTLLHLPPNSPDAAIFIIPNNTSSSSSPPAASASAAVNWRPQLDEGIFIILAVFAQATFPLILLLSYV